MSSNFYWNARHHADLTFHVLLFDSGIFPYSAFFLLLWPRTSHMVLLKFQWFRKTGNSYIFNPKWLMLLKIIFSTTDIRTLESKRRAKFKLSCQRSMGMQSFIMPVQISRQFPRLLKFRGRFLPIIERDMIHRKKPIDEGSGDAK